MNNEKPLTIADIVQKINTGARIPASNIIGPNLDAAIAISKMVLPRDRTNFDIGSNNPDVTLDQSRVQAISDSVITRLKDNENILKLFPDNELAALIIISSILSPKDMVKTEFNYSVPDMAVPPEMAATMLSEIQKAYENVYHIKDQAQDILRDMLFESGAHVKVILPEAIVDELINSDTAISTEALSDIYDVLPSGESRIKHLGFLGSGTETNMSLEALIGKDRNYNASVTYQIGLEDGSGQKTETIPGLEVIDNFSVLKMPKIMERLRKNYTREIVRRNSTSRNAGTENIHNGKLSTREMAALVYKSNQMGTKTFVTVPDNRSAKRKSVGRPLVMQLPTESVIPIYVPGSPEKHIGYFILIDSDGNPLTQDSNRMYIEGLSGILQNAQRQDGLQSMLINKAKNNLLGPDNAPTIDQMLGIYTNIVETNLLRRLGNGPYGENVRLADNIELYRIMLARSFANKATRILFVPSELVTYFAVKYFRNGVGKSYLDDLRILSSMRAALLLARVNAQAKAAINVTQVNAEIDPRDPDPDARAEQIVHHVMKMRQNYLPMGTTSFPELHDWIQRAGLMFNFSGHSKLPNTKLEFQSQNMQAATIDSELDDNLRKYCYMHFGLTPEIVDNGYSADFAQTIINNNILMSKRNAMTGEAVSLHLTDFGKKICLNDTVLYSRLREIIGSNKGALDAKLTEEEKADMQENEEAFLDTYLERFIECLRISLPQPDVTVIKDLKENFDDYMEAVSAGLDYVISTELLTNDLNGKIATHIDAIKANYKAMFARRWMAENGFLPELQEIISIDDGKPSIDLYEILKAHNETLIVGITKYIEAMKPSQVAADKDLEKLGVGEGDSSSSFDSGGSSGSDDGLGGGFDDLGSFGGDGLDEEPPAGDDTATGGSEEGNGGEPSEDKPVEDDQPKSSGADIID